MTSSAGIPVPECSNFHRTLMRNGYFFGSTPAGVSSRTRNRSGRPSSSASAMNQGSRSSVGELIRLMMSQNPPRQCAGDFPVSKHGRPVDDHVADSLRVMMGIFVGRNVANRLWIEDHHIGLHSGAEDAAITELPSRGGERCHLAHRFLQREEMFVADVMAEDARESAVGARVRTDFAHHSDYRTG